VEGGLLGVSALSAFWILLNCKRQARSLWYKGAFRDAHLDDSLVPSRGDAVPAELLCGEGSTDQAELL
jgi:hypothetical protein